MLVLLHIILIILEITATFFIVKGLIKIENKVNELHIAMLEKAKQILEINDEIVAMSFGERISDDTALIQIELADEKYRGAYQAINKLFCENEWKDLTYVNREEDMGIEGLKKAKMSYQPEFLIEKYYLWEE